MFYPYLLDSIKNTSCINNGYYFLVAKIILKPNLTLLLQHSKAMQKDFISAFSCFASFVLRFITYIFHIYTEFRVIIVSQKSNIRLCSRNALNSASNKLMVWHLRVELGTRVNRGRCYKERYS
jgi:hypothetical protein